MYPIELSGGMKQRMVMVISTLLNPSLLIADEITSALDVSTQKAVAEMLVEFRDRGFVKSMIVITHDISILYQVADTILVMYAGKLAEKAPADVIINAPRHPVHEAADRLAAGGRRPVRRAEAARAFPGQPPSLLDPPAGLPLPRPLPARVSACAEAAAVRPGRRRAIRSRAGRCSGERAHPARQRLQGLQGRRLRRRTAHRGARRQLRRSTRARSSR